MEGEGRPGIVTDGGLLCEDCLRSRERERPLPAEGFHVQALPLPNTGTRLRALCRRHRGKLSQYQWVDLKDGHDRYVLQEVMDT